MQNETVQRLLDIEEIKQRSDPVLAAAGAVLFLEKVSPALDTSTARPARLGRL
jgi:hypothetical protein